MGWLNNNTDAMFEWLRHHIKAIIELEIHYYALNYIILPLAVFLGLYINNRFHLLFHIFSYPKNIIGNWIIELSIKDIEKSGKKGELDKLYIKNALLEAESGDSKKRINAIKQLRQYYGEDEVLHGLIKMLHREKELHLIYIIVFTLHIICDKRRKAE